MTEVVQDPTVVDVDLDCAQCGDPIKPRQKSEQCTDCNEIIHARKNCFVPHGKSHEESEVTRETEFSLGLHKIPPDQLVLDQFQPRSSTIVTDEFEESIDSTNGNIEPITAAVIDEKLSVIIGNTRTKACQQLDLEVLVNVIEATEEEAWEMSIMSNLARTDLTLFEEIIAYDKLKQLGQTDAEIAKKSGKNLTRVNALLRVFSIVRADYSILQNFIEEGVGFTDLRAVAPLTEMNAIINLLNYKLQVGWKTSFVEDHVSLQLDVKWIQENISPDAILSDEFFITGSDGDLIQNVRRHEVGDYVGKYLVKQRGWDIQYLSKLFGRSEEYSKSNTFRKKYEILEENYEKDRGLTEIRKEAIDFVDQEHFKAEHDSPEEKKLEYYQEALLIIDDLDILNALVSEIYEAFKSNEPVEINPDRDLDFDEQVEKEEDPKELLIQEIEKFYGTIDYCGSGGRYNDIHNQAANMKRHLIEGEVTVDDGKEILERLRENLTELNAEAEQVDDDQTEIIASSPPAGDENVPPSAGGDPISEQVPEQVSELDAQIEQLCTELNIENTDLQTQVDEQHTFTLVPLIRQMIWAKRNLSAPVYIECVGYFHKMRQAAEAYVNIHAKNANGGHFEYYKNAPKLKKKSYGYPDGTYEIRSARYNIAELLPQLEEDLTKSKDRWLHDSMDINDQSVVLQHRLLLKCNGDGKSVNVAPIFSMVPGNSGSPPANTTEQLVFGIQ